MCILIISFALHEKRKNCNDNINERNISSRSRSWLSTVRNSEFPCWLPAKARDPNLLCYLTLWDWEASKWAFKMLTVWEHLNAPAIGGHYISIPNNLWLDQVKVLEKPYLITDNTKEINTLTRRKEERKRGGGEERKEERKRGGARRKKENGGKREERKKTWGGANEQKKMKGSAL